VKMGKASTLFWRSQSESRMDLALLASLLKDASALKKLQEFVDR